MLKQLKENMNALQKNKHTDLNEIKKSIQNMRIEFNKEIKLLKKNKPR